METYPIVVIGGSAGGLTALLELVSGLPAQLPAALLVTLHSGRNNPGSYVSLLSGRCALPAALAVHEEALAPGRIYVAPPDFHLLVERVIEGGSARGGECGRVILSHGPRENRQRPAVDPLFRSAARAFGPRVLGVVLSGTLDDGTSGLLAIKARGGTALVQEPSEASFPGMPQSAIDHVKIDAVLTIAELTRRIIAFAERAQQRLAAESAPPSGGAGEAVDDEQLDLELQSTNLAASTLDRTTHPGQHSEFACPDCGGVLWEIKDGGLVRYRCRVGHALTSRALLAAQSSQLEDALWTALRALEEKIALTRSMAARNTGHFRQSLLEDERDAMEHADQLRRMLKLEEFQIRE